MSSKFQFQMTENIMPLTHPSPHWGRVTGIRLLFDASLIMA